MKFAKWTSVAFALFAALAITTLLTAQDNPNHEPKHHQYKLMDVGTFGGPNSYPAIFVPFLSSNGTFVGVAETAVADPYYPNCLLLGCFVGHAFQWQSGVLTDLGALPGNNGGNSSYAFAVNANGLVSGNSENGSIDSATGYPELNAVVWKKGKIVNLGTFGGAQSLSAGLNNRGQVVGWALNTTDDVYSGAFQSIGVNSGFPGTTQTRAFLWEDGVKTDLGTLGGPDAQAYAINQRGQVAGQSFTSSTPNPTTGIPTIDPFLWDKGTMADLGTLGGTIGFPIWMNNRGQVVGQSNVAGDSHHHPFLWDRGVLTDLGTLGGSDGAAFWISDAGGITGYGSVTGDQTYHAVVWKNGKMTDLGALSGFPRSVGISINNSNQIVGNVATSDFSVFHGMLWEGDGPILDLNAFVPSGSGVTLTQGDFINERGEIAAHGTISNGDIHAFLLVPDGDCDSDCEQRIAASQSSASQYPTAVQQNESPAETVNQLRNLPKQRYHLLGQPVAPRD